MSAASRFIIVSFFYSDFPVYVARAYDSERGIVAVKFSHPYAIEKETRILSLLADAGVNGIVPSYGCYYTVPFYGFSMELHQASVVQLIYNHTTSSRSLTHLPLYPSLLDSVV